MAKKKVDGRFLKISKEHEIVKHYLQSFQQVIDQGILADTFPAVKDKMKTFRQDFEHHFEVEELFLFPTALLCISTFSVIDLILKLQKEHGMFLKDVERIEDLVRSQREDDKQMHELLFNQIKQFTIEMEQHVKDEMNILFPQLDGNDRALQIIKDYSE